MRRFSVLLLSHFLKLQFSAFTLLSRRFRAENKMLAAGGSGVHAVF